MNEDIQSRLARLSPEKRALLQRRLSERGSGVSAGNAIPHQADGSWAPLSPAQQQVWITSALNGGEAAYHMSRLLRLHGPLDQEALAQALDLVVQRHAVYRTDIVEHQGFLRQQVRPQRAVTLETAALAEDWQAQVRALVVRPFRHGQDPLLRATLLRRSGSEHLFVLVVHHLISDGLSMALLLSEIASGYNQLTAKQATRTDAPTEPTYGDVAHWLREREQAGAFAEDLAYWTARLAGTLPILSLPGDHSRPTRASGRGFFLTCMVPPDLTREVAAFAKSRGATVFMVMLAAYQALLHRLSGQTDVLVGTPVAGRQRVELENVHGFLVSTVVVRSDLGADPGFDALLAQVKDATLAALQHQNVPFETVVTALKPERTQGVHPVFQTIFLVNTVAEPPRFSALGSAPEHVDAGTAMFDLLLEISSEERGQVCYWEANSDLFEPATVRAWMGHYLTLLAAAIAAPAERISTLPLLTAAERQHILKGWNRSERSYPRDRCVHELVLEQAARSPERIAAVADGRQLTYGDLAQRITKLAAQLRARGIGPGSLVAVCMPRSLDLPVALLGTLAAGAAYIPLDAQYPAARIAQIIEDARPALVLTQGDEWHPFASAAVTEFTLAAGWERLPLPVRENALRTPSPDDLAYVIYTSGSTGRPKGVQIPHRAVVNFLFSMRATPGFKPDDCLVAVTTISFDIAVLELFTPMITGARVVIADRETAADGARLAALLDASRATHFQATPVTMRLLLEARWAGSPRIKLLCGGEAISRDLANRLLPLCAELWNMYGPTETTVWSSADRIEAGDGPVLIGTPIANTRFHILDHRRQPQPIGVVGDLYIGGDGLACGYVNLPQQTAERFIADPFEQGCRLYATGDVARYRPDGRIEFLGRSDHQIKIRGFRIELGDIEAVLAEHPSVRECVVIARAHGGEQQLFAYVVAHDPVRFSTDLVRKALRERLPPYMVPAAIVVLPTLPRTANGKLDRKALPAAEAAPLSDQAKPTAPPQVSLSLHFQLIQLWEEVLGVVGVRLDDDFFAIGGNSLLAYRMMTTLEQHIGRRLSMAVLFKNPTILGLCEAILSDGAALDRPVLPVQSGATTTRPLFFLHGDFLGGGYYCVNLARRLGTQVPFYALVPKRIDLSLPVPSIEDLASYYIREMRAISPTGPYLLGGFCIGGLIAFEIARQLHEQGEQIALLALIDSPSSYPPERLSRWLTRFAALASGLRPGRQLVLFNWLNNRLDRLRELSLGKVITVALGKLRLRRTPETRPMAGTAGGAVVTSTQAAHDQMTAYVWAACAYRPRPLAAQAHLVVSDEFAATNVDRTLGWSGNTQGLDLHRTQGSHLDSITVNLPVLAEVLRPLIGSANGSRDATGDGEPQVAAAPPLAAVPTH